MTILEIGREKIPENGWELNRWSHLLIAYQKVEKELFMIQQNRTEFCYHKNNQIEKYANYIESNLGINYSVLKSKYIEIIGNIDLNGMNILEIGPGNGLFCHFLATHFNVNCVDAIDEYEGHGADKENIHVNTELSNLLKHSKVTIIKDDILCYKTKKKYDVIFATHVLHHVIETKKILQKDSLAKNKCVELFLKLKSILNPGGIFIVQDVSRKNITPFKHYKKQTEVVDWATKQNANEWALSLKHSGFQNIIIEYVTPRPLRKVNFFKRICNNYFVNILFNSLYIIRAK